MSLGEYSGWRRHGEEIEIGTDQGILGVSFTGDDIVRLRFNKGPALLTQETFVIDGTPGACELEVAEHDWGLILQRGSLLLKIKCDPLGLVLERHGKRLLASAASGLGDLEDGKTAARFMLGPAERIYGLGQDPMARLDQRDRERRMWQEWGGVRRSGNAGIPFYISSGGYGLLLNSSWPARFAVGRAETAAPTPAYAADLAPAPWPWDATSGEVNPDQLAVVLDHGIMDLFIICQDTVDEIEQGYAGLTGHAPMPPKWALGFIQSKNRYRSQEELLYIAREYRRRRIPCDALVIDWLWFEHFGDLEWSKRAWPDPLGMLAELAGMGFHVMQAQHPYVDVESSKYNEFKEKGYLNATPSGRPTFDFSHPEAREGWWNEIRRLYREGVRGYWTDMGELEQHPAGTVSRLGPRERVHNIYSLLWAKALYDGQRADGGERVFTLARTAYAGIQRYGAALWSGDIMPSWDVLRDQVVIGQGVALSGQQYWTTDIGGYMRFAPEFTAELYLRWFQWGAFCPLFRTHGVRPANEAWAFGEQAERILTDFIKLRYRLLPYIYSCARQVTERGAPIMRAMCVDFPDDPAAVAEETQFMFGPAFLVAPVLEEGARSRRVYLPAGLWYDFWTDARLLGGRWIETSAPLSRIPLFVRAGSIIPMGPAIEHTGEPGTDRLELHAYPGKEGTFALYDDDGVTYAYEQGGYRKIILRMDLAGEIGFEGCSNFDPAIVRHDIATVQNGDEPAAEADYDISVDNVCTVHVLIGGGDQNAAIEAKLTPPAGWGLRNSSSTYYDVPQEVITAKVHGVNHLTWEMIPTAAALPLRQECRVEVVMDKDLTFCRSLTIGSGYATRWLIAGHFEDFTGGGLDHVFGPELDEMLPCYADGDRVIPWHHIQALDFNCFGYVQLFLPELKLPRDKAVAYAKCRVWSEEACEGCLELAAEPAVKLWLNGEVIYKHHGILLPGILPEPFRLRQGWNDLLVKVANNGGIAINGRDYGFSLRIVDRGGEVMNKLLYAV